jgi:Kef-type K+ transport system membrane component KefB
LRFATAIQAWRAGGIVFIAFYAYGLLPGVFAWPAGLGDMAIGATAPWLVLSLIRDRGFAAGRAYRVWNWLGILDLVVAVGIGASISALARGLPGEITTAPMTLLPLVLIPAYLVPIFVMLHFTALYQSRRMARAW